ncbi:MAG: O-antigen ligase family protein [Candidatus Sulfotelmatobacter sp.]
MFDPGRNTPDTIGIVTQPMPEAKKKSNILGQIALCLVFTLSFATYMAPNLSVSLQLAPLALFAALVFFKVLWSDSLLTALAGFFETDGLLYLIFLSALMLESSLGSKLNESFQFALLLSSCLLLARVYMAVVSIKEVLEAFYWSALLSILIFLPLSFETLMQSITTFSRLIPLNFHPNLLALQLSGYLCVLIWKFISGGWPTKTLCGLAGLVCIAGILLASSRGAIVGVAAGFVFVFGTVIAKSAKHLRKRTIKISLVVVTLLAAFFVLVSNMDSTRDAYAVLDQVLSLSTPDRGLDSGMSGRVDMWHEALRVFSDGTWLLGHGVRSSDAAYTYPMIDNSYLVILYDMGVVPLILIAWRFVSILLRVARNAFRAADKDFRGLYIACGMFLVVLLVTSIVERSLFAVGNPFSLLAFLFFATPTRCLELHGNGSMIHRQRSTLIQDRLALGG